MLSFIMNVCKKKKFECRVCNKEFSSDKELETHNNTGEHKYSVEIANILWDELNGTKTPV